MNATLFAAASAPWPLAVGSVHVWRFACTQLLGAAATRLPLDERRAADRFVAAEHRASYLVQRVMMRSLLARYLDADPWTLTLVRAARGKPSVIGAGDLEFNISHADDVALLAVARGLAVGVDIERISADIDPRALGPTVLAPAEAATVDGTARPFGGAGGRGQAPTVDGTARPFGGAAGRGQAATVDGTARPFGGAGGRGQAATAEHRRAFLRIWCRKEACLKAVGIGLLDDLTSLSVIPDRVALRGATIDIQDLAMGDAHAAALATTAPCAAIVPVAVETYFVKS